MLWEAELGCAQSKASHAWNLGGVQGMENPSSCAAGPAGLGLPGNSSRTDWELRENPDFDGIQAVTGEDP